MAILVCYGRVYCNPDDRLSHQKIPISHASSLFLIGSFGASSVLIFATPNVPYAQPGNLLGAYLISALIGVRIAQYVDFPVEFQAALVVSLSILFMLVSNTVHPAGRATGLIAVMGHDEVDEMGYHFLLQPVLSGLLIMLVIALLFNNLSSNYERHYPRHWW
mgnify:CR=1 FL=1